MTSNMMNLYFMEIFQKEMTGFTTYKNELFAGLKKVNGIKLHVITLGSPIKELTHTRKDEVNYYYIPSIKGQPKDKIAFLLLQFIDDTDKLFFFINYAPSYPTVRMLKEYFPSAKVIDVIHDFMWTPYLLGDVERLKRIVNHEEQSQLSQGIEYFFEEGCKSYHAADRVVCLSKDTYEILESQYQIPASKLQLIPNGLSSPAWEILSGENDASKQKSSKEKIILYVGRVSYPKGIIDVLECFSQVLGSVPNCKLVIAGQIEDQMRKKIDWHFAGKVILLGMLPKEKLYEWYQNADVGLMPSYYEQCSYVGIEMKMFGLLVVASDGIGVRSMFDATNSIIAAIGDRTNPRVYRRNLANSIVEALSLSEDVIAVFRVKSRTHYEKKYSIGHMAQSYIELLKCFRAQ